MHAHTLVIGGTGMLAEASLHLLGDSRHSSWLARTPASLQALRARAGAAAAGLDCHAVDYRDPVRLDAAIAALVAAFGPPDRVLAWCHGDQAAVRLADGLARHGARPVFHHVLGSARARPPVLATARLPFEALGLDYRTIALGFVCEPGGARWLQHAEISQGVLAAMAGPDTAAVVGQLEPWSARP